MRSENLTTIEAAAWLGLAKSTLEKARVTGAGPMFLKLGRAVRYRREDLESWALARKVVSTSEFGQVRVAEQQP
jgi:predicted DNA-binding transcriptional regulator AlpA